MFNADCNADIDDAFRHVEKTTTVVTVKPLFLRCREQPKHALHLFIMISYWFCPPSHYNIMMSHRNQMTNIRLSHRHIRHTSNSPVPGTRGLVLQYAEARHRYTSRLIF